MATKKFDTAKINTEVGTSVMGTIAQATSTSKRGQQATAGKKERAERLEEGRTQGRKGCKAQRINMAFTTDNYIYIQRMAKIFGMTMTGFANKMLDTYRQEHGEMYDEALAEITRMKQKMQENSAQDEEDEE